MLKLPPATDPIFGWLAQPAERVVHTDEVTGSSPVPPTTTKPPKLLHFPHEPAARLGCGLMVARRMIMSDSKPSTPHATKPTGSPNACETTPINSGPTMSPSSLKEPAAPMVAPILPALAKPLTSASVLVQTVP